MIVAAVILIAVMVNGSSILDVAEQLSVMQASVQSVSDLSEFRRLFPLESLLKTRADLFLRSDGSEPIGELVRDLGVSRIDAVDNFITHNYNQLDDVLLKMLATSEPTALAAVISRPLEATDGLLLQPITSLIDDYTRVRSRRCLLDFLPDVFEDPAVYDTYFTPIDGYRVIPRDEIGYTAVIPNDPLSRMIRERGGSWMSSGRKGLVGLYVEPSGVVPLSVLIDVRCGCAVSINRPYHFGNIIDLDNWLVLKDSNQGGASLVWRKDSVEPLTVPSCIFRVTADLSFAVSFDGYLLPNDPQAPFVPSGVPQALFDPQNATAIDEALMRPHQWFNIVTKPGDDGSLAILSDRLLTKSRKFSEALTKTLTLALGCSMEELADRLSRDFDRIRSVYLIINRLAVESYDDVWMMVTELCARFNLRSRDELLGFILAVIHGERPIGVDIPLPVRFMSHTAVLDF